MRNLWDLQSLLYLALYAGLVVGQWIAGFSWLLYGCLLFITIGVQVIHHNHVHLGIWHNRSLNRLTNCLISLLTAVPSATMRQGHIQNHHRHQHGPEDITRTYRFGGDHNHVVGYLLHPIQALSVLIPEFWREFGDGLPKRSRFSQDLLLQLGLVFTTWSVLMLVDWRKCLVLVLMPQLFGLHWLLGANYFQHAHCDGASDSNRARNFTGVINWLWFNIGFHTAHHQHPNEHWSQLRRLHDELCQHVDPRLINKSFVAYVARTFFASLFVAAYRSESLGNHEPNCLVFKNGKFAGSNCNGILSESRKTIQNPVRRVIRATPESN